MLHSKPAQNELRVQQMDDPRLWGTHLSVPPLALFGCFARTFAWGQAAVIAVAIPCSVFGSILQLKASTGRVADIRTSATHQSTSPTLASKLGPVTLPISGGVPLLVVFQLLFVRLRIAGVKISR